MKNSWDSAVAVLGDEKVRVREHVAKAEFQSRFKRALTRCVRRGFSLEESFGMIWEETLELIELSEDAQSELYPELIAWAKDHGR